MEHLFSTEKVLSALIDGSTFVYQKELIYPKDLLSQEMQKSARYNATHYTISPNYRMTKNDFLRLLDDLRRNALERQKALKIEKGGE